MLGLAARQQQQQGMPSATVVRSDLAMGFGAPHDSVAATRSPNAARSTGFDRQPHFDQTGFTPPLQQLNRATAVAAVYAAHRG